MVKYRDMGDGTLVELSLIGEGGAFDELVERYEDAVLEKAEQIVGNSFSAEDIAQDTFFSAWEHLGELRYPTGFGTWILRIAENRAKNLLRQYESNLPGLAADMDSFPLTASNSVTPQTAENSERLREAVNALSAALRDTVRLHYLAGYTVREISALLSVPEGTVKRRLNEGRKQLRRGFGLPEDGNDGIAARVRRQITEIKRRAEKNDQSGFAETYEYVLPLVYQMEETPEKQKMLAEVLLRGMWWIPGQNSEETFAKVKAAALEGLNEDVMQVVADREDQGLHGEERIRFIRDKQIPELRTAGFRIPLGGRYFWLGYELAGLGRIGEAMDAFGEVLNILPPSHVYYANAISSIEMEKRFAKAEDPAGTHIACMGEAYEKENGKWRFVSQPGYTRGTPGRDMDAVLFFWLSQCDGLIDDPAMKPGDIRVSEDGKVTLTMKKADEPVSVPAGVYENCLIYETKGQNMYPIDIETVVCPGVGIVKQTNRVKGVRFLLTSAEVRGAGRIPFAVGNRWTYHAESEEEGILWQDEQTVEIVYATEKRITASVRIYAEERFDTATWTGNRKAAANLYYGPKGLRDVEPYLSGMERLAVTPRERAYTAAAVDVMRRIFATDPEFNPDPKEYGAWNFFKLLPAARTEWGVSLDTVNRTDAFEWKLGGRGPGFRAVLYNYLYEIVATAWGGIWFDEWKPGFSGKKEHMERGHVTGTALSVGENEKVTVTAGTFPDCRHITAEVKCVHDYWSGHLEFWYAPGVGLVKFLRLGTAENEAEERKGPFVWELTEYRGTGEGFFPLDNGLFRRYEPANRPLPDGYRGWVEYTFSTDEEGTVIFKNAGGIQSREGAEKLFAADKERSAK